MTRLACQERTATKLYNLSVDKEWLVYFKDRQTTLGIAELLWFMSDILV